MSGLRTVNKIRAAQVLDNFLTSAYLDLDKKSVEVAKTALDVLSSDELIELPLVIPRPEVLELALVLELLLRTKTELDDSESVFLGRLKNLTAVFLSALAEDDSTESSTSS